MLLAASQICGTKEEIGNRYIGKNVFEINVVKC